MKYLLCFSGGLSSFYNYTRYHADIQLMISTFLSLDGFDPQRVTVLFGDGTTSFTVGAANVVAGIGTKDSLLSAIHNLSSTLKADDMFFFVASNHGGPSDPGVDGSILWCWNDQQITSAELSQAIGAVAASTQVFIFGQCYSGGFVSALNSSKQAVFTACRADEVSYATDDSTYDEFLYQFAKALASAPTPTLRQAFAATLLADKQAEHPQMSDPGNISDRTNVLGAP